MDRESKMTPTIAAGIAKAQRFAQGVAKNGRSKQGGGYAYAVAEDMIAEGRISLAEGGLFLMGVGWTFQPLQEERVAKTKAGDDGRTKTLASAIGRISVRYLLVHEAGDALEIETSAPVVPEFGRPDDKAEYGALTECHAYLIRELLNLPRGIAGAIDMNQRPDDYEPPSSGQRPATTPLAEPPPAQRPAEPTSRVQDIAPPPAAPPAREAAYDPAHVALCNELCRRAKDTEIPGQEIFDAILDARLPKDLQDKAMVALLEDMLATEQGESLKSWVMCLVDVGAVVPMFARVLGSAQSAADVDKWLGVLKLCALPADSPERAAVKPIVDAAVQRTGWTMTAKAA